MIDDANAGYPVGFSELIENWKQGKRQIASTAYDLASKPNVKIITGVLVKRVILDQNSGAKRAVGAETEGGEAYYANKEVIVSCGAYRTPQLLLLSGIGPEAEVARHGIKLEADLPVGLHFHDHLSLNQFWRLANPEQGLSMGTPSWNDPVYQLGLPCDWVTYTPAPVELLEAALNKDEENSLLTAGKGERSWARGVAQNGRANIETFIVYAPAGAPIQGADIPLDGSHITTCVLSMHPTSRCSITLSSSNPRDPPAIDPNYYATESDRVVLRTGIRQAMDVVTSLKTKDGKAIVAEETPPPGRQALASGSSDSQIDERVRTSGQTFYHAGGGANLGHVVDSECRVKGIEGLRVADASVMPAPVSAHYQAVVYAIAEQVAEVIGNAN